MHVIINGVSSETLQGVQILSLPPITKPRMRTSIALIDGRPGDIITDLGYEAYNRKIHILLHHTFNIDAITAFFNQSGTIVFSNEPNRIYKFETIDAINYERAVQFKTADVTFHVQPYKTAYPAESQTITTTSGTVVNQGNTLSAPRLTVTGSGTVTINLDGSTIFTITMPSGGTITIDSESLDAYAGNNLANRSVNGNYESLRLTPGSHTIQRTGGTRMVVENASRWI